MTILELREKRAKAWEATKAFLDSHRNDKGMLSAKDDATYSRMEQEITDLGKEIARLERQEALDAELNRPVLFLTVAFGLIGFLDDYLKVVLKRSDGLMPMQKMALQIIVTAVFAFYLVKVADIPLTMLVPFSNGYYLDIGWMAVPLLFVAVIGTVNGTNFTDGLDGLASSVTVLVATFFTVVAIGTKSGIEPVTCAVVGALLGFLLFNVYPASVFMGDTGSLALGGFVAGTAYMMQMPLFILIVGIIYLVEVASVMIQVTYFKKTGGKRFFKMAPIHHHFELCGWSETRVVAVFSIITALLCLIALMGV